MDLYGQALDRFSLLYGRVKRLKLKEPAAMTLSTADDRGRVSSRTVLLKAFDRRGFVFCSNWDSRKGKALKSNPQAALCFHWDAFREQVTVEGRVRPVSAAESDAFWRGRPRESQIGAWASHQSRPLRARKTLLDRAARYRADFSGEDVPRPGHWGGFRLVPDRIEFWKAGAFRLNHRDLFQLKRGRWSRGLLFP